MAERTAALQPRIALAGLLASVGVGSFAPAALSLVAALSMAALSARGAVAE